MAIGKSGFIPDEKKDVFPKALSVLLSPSIFPSFQKLDRIRAVGHKKGHLSGAVSDHEGIFDQ
ncbi:MAG: hypothetical protein R2860_08675 [Desulfobacterales bacterium]